MLKDWFRKHFVPHQDNGYKPHILQETAVVGMMCLIIITFAVSNLQSFLWIASDWMVSTILPAVIVSDTNEERGQADLLPLTRNEVLDQAAQLKADDMARGHYFSHNSPSGLSPWYWFKMAGYNYVHAGENLAVHFTDSSEVVDAWMNSPSHRANIMDAKFREIGIGVAKGTYEGYDTVFVVQLFGTEAAVAVEPVTSAVAQSEAVVEDPEDDSGDGSVELAEAEVITAPSVAGAETALLEVTTDADASVVATDTAPTTTETVDVTDKGTVVISSYVSTSTGGIPATVSGGGEVTTPPALALATQPHKVIQFIYVLIGLFVAISLALSIVIEFRRQQPIQMAYGVGLLVLMLVLFQVHISISGGALIV